MFSMGLAEIDPDIGCLGAFKEKFPFILHGYDRWPESSRIAEVGFCGIAIACTYIFRFRHVFELVPYSRQKTVGVRHL